MKRIFLSLLFLLLVWGKCWATDYTQDARCVGAYIFSEGSGTTVADSSGTGNTGNFKGNGEPAWSSTVPGTFVSYSANFDGTDDRISLGSVGSADPDFTWGTGDFTLIFWTYTDSWGSGARGIIGAKVTDGSSGWLLYCDGGSPTKINGRLSGTNNFFTTTAMPTGSWSHWALTRASGTNLTWYYLGSSDNTGTNNSDISLSLGDTTWLGWNETHNGYFDGLITDLGLFNNDLSSTEINDIMDNGLVGAAPPTGYGQVI